MTKLKNSIGVVSKCYLCAALQRGMKAEMKCSVVEMEAVQSGKRKGCKYVQLETAPKKKKKRADQ